MSYVVDNSVVIKWFVDEHGSAQAVPLMHQSLSAPDLLVPEFVNAMRGKVARGMLSADEAGAAVKALQSCGISFEPCLPLANDMLELALKLSHPAYDCAYLALARKLGCALITADERLIARCLAVDATELGPHVRSLYQTGIEVQESPPRPYRPRPRKLPNLRIAEDALG